MKRVHWMWLRNHTGPSWWVFQPGEDREPEEGASHFLGNHHCWRTRLPQPPAGLHYQRAARRMPASRRHHQTRYTEESLRSSGTLLVSNSLFINLFFPVETIRRITHEFSLFAVGLGPDLPANVFLRSPTVLNSLCILRWRSAEHQRRGLDATDVQRSRFHAEGTGRSVPRGAPCHPDHVGRVTGGHRGWRRERFGWRGGRAGRSLQLDAAVDTMVGLTEVQLFLHLGWILHCMVQVTLFLFFASKRHNGDMLRKTKKNLMDSDNCWSQIHFANGTAI